MKIIKTVLEYKVNNIIIATIENYQEIKRHIRSSNFDNYDETELNKEVWKELASISLPALIDCAISEYHDKETRVIMPKNKYVYYDNRALRINFNEQDIQFKTLYGWKNSKFYVEKGQDFYPALSYLYAHTSIIYIKHNNVCFDMLFENEPHSEF